MLLLLLLWLSATSMLQLQWQWSHGHNTSSNRHRDHSLLPLLAERQQREPGHSSANRTNKPCAMLHALLRHERGRCRGSGRPGPVSRQRVSCIGVRTRVVFCIGMVCFHVCSVSDNAVT